MNWRRVGMKVLAQIAKLYDKLLDLMAFMACILILVIMVGVSVDVVCRYLFNAPILGVLEITEYLLLLICMLGAAWLLRINGHVNIDIVIGYLDGKKKAALNLVMDSICAVVCGFIVYLGAITTWDNFQRGIVDIKVLEVPKYLYLMTIPIGFFFLTIEFLRKVFGHVKRARETEKEEPLAF